MRDWRLFLALGGGSGLAPRAPGTAGTAAAWLLFALLHTAIGLPAATLLALAALMLAAGAHICAHGARALAAHDDGRIVWDEIAAFFALLALLPSDWGWHWQAAAFGLFRFFDAAKPFPIGWLDQKITGGTGIMADDIAAAAATGAALAAMHWLFF